MTKNELNSDFFSSENYYKSEKTLVANVPKMTLSELVDYLKRLEVEEEILMAEGKYTDFLYYFTKEQKKEIYNYLDVNKN